MRAAERALPLMRGGQILRFALLPDGEDPGQLPAPARRRRRCARSLDKARAAVGVRLVGRERAQLPRPRSAIAGADRGAAPQLRSFEIAGHRTAIIRQGLKRRFGELLGRAACRASVRRASGLSRPGHGSAITATANRPARVPASVGAAASRGWSGVGSPGSKRRWRARKPRAKPGSCCLCCAIRNGCRAARTISACCQLTRCRSWSGCASEIVAWFAGRAQSLTQRPCSATSALRFWATPGSVRRRPHAADRAGH